MPAPLFVKFAHVKSSCSLVASFREPAMSFDSVVVPLHSLPPRYVTVPSSSMRTSDLPSYDVRLMLELVSGHGHPQDLSVAIPS